ncbi:hypothetical protein ACQCTC_10105, partial [Ralstonia pseudosolanacearum]
NPATRTPDLGGNCGCKAFGELVARAQWALPLDAALRQEGAHGTPMVFAEGMAGAARFADGAGRHGAPG